MSKGSGSKDHARCLHLRVSEIRSEQHIPADIHRGSISAKAVDRPQQPASLDPDNGSKVEASRETVPPGRHTQGALGALRVAPACLYWYFWTNPSSALVLGAARAWVGWTPVVTSQNRSK